MTSTTGVKIPPVHNSLKLKALDPASQAGRITFPGQTRGQKADRLQLVAKIAPIAESDAALHHWSATGVAVTGGNAYISWHSNHQASEIENVSIPADAWGGALDVVSIAALMAPQQGVNPISNTMTSLRVKFNNVVADGGNLYFPLTCYNNGAVVGRMAIGSTEAMDTIGIPGSSANAVYVQGNTIYAATGYAGGVFSMPSDFTDETEFTVVAPYSQTFGGKYIADGYVLRTDDTESQLVPLAGGEARSLGAPLTSAEKYAEAYDPANGVWYPLQGETAAHFGKHTMAIANDYIYVAGGKGQGTVNGLRVYGSTGNAPVWQNGTNTTAVCVEGDYVYAATGAGLRVYEKYDGTNLKLYAYEVKEYDNDGNAIGHTAGTDAHSSNFVAVDSQSGLIFVACGQSGVYVFRLNHDAPATEITVSLNIPSINHTESDKIDVDSETGKDFIIPSTVPSEEGKDFKGWATTQGADEPQYQPGETVTIKPDSPNIILYPVFKDHEYKWTVNFDGHKPANRPAEDEVTGVPATVKSDAEQVTLPTQTPSLKDMEFKGWSADPNADIRDENLVLIPAGSTFTPSSSNVTLYAVWAVHVSGGGSQGEGGDVKPDEGNQGSGTGGEGGSGDTKPGEM